MQPFRISMSDIIPLIGLPYPPAGRISYNVPCPCCDDKPKKKHLNINLKKDVFRCPRCGVHGGVLAIYSLYTGISQSQVRDVLMERLNVPTEIRQKPLKVVPTEILDYPLTDIDSRHATYTALLNRLSLASDHLANLTGRGLTKEIIEKLGYKTTPMTGTNVLAKQLAAEGLYLAGVPGFYKTDTDTWTFSRCERGILIPVRDEQGRIQGLQVRRDNVKRRKFRWVSSVGKKDGCKAEGWVHMAGPMQSTILLTEGPMKADIIHALSGDTVLSVPGVNTLSHLQEMLPSLREAGVEKIMTAFDMDFLQNPHVQNGYQNLTQILDSAGLHYGTYLWDPAYKGLDDYIWSLRQSRTE